MKYTDCKVSLSELVDGFSVLSADLQPSSVAAANEMLEHAIRLGINNAPRAAMFLANCAHESNFFTQLEENLNYSAKRLMQVWPSRFPDMSTARKYANNPKALANFVYNGRMGNRPGSDDGWNYRGSGLIQLTGKNNFAIAADRIGIPIDDIPEKVRTELITAWWTAIDFFVHARYKGKSLLEWADLGNHAAVCRGVNGGTHGLSERTAYARMLLETFTQEEGLFTLPLVKLGSRGNSVKVVQQKLRLLGYKIYRVDGVFGEGTQKAVIQYQKDYGLVPDGIVGGKTLLNLNANFKLKG
jgi:putative chitinase